MKTLILCALALFLSIQMYAQSPGKMSYQAIVRDAQNNLLSSQSVGVRVMILQGPPSGLAVYVETHAGQTNTNGLLTLAVGGGTTVQGDFSSIDWSQGPYFIQTEIDPTGGNLYTITTTSQLMSVPYALYAEKSGNPVPGPAGIDGLNGKSVLNGTVAPLATDGQDGDFYINTTTSEIYGPKTSGAWGTGISLVGAQGLRGLTGATGPQGVAGPVGPSGQTVLNGTVAPLATDGQDGDFYINTITSEIYGPKTSGTWGSGVSLIGATGAQGPIGLTGPAGTPGTNGTDGTNGKSVLNGSTAPLATLGVDGDFYINTATNEIYGPKTSGSWGAATSLVGPQGPAASPGHYVGELYGGGVVFYVDGTGQHGLIMSTEDLSLIAPWGQLGTDLSNCESPWDGNGNSNAILPGAAVGDAAELCNASTLGGQSDWYLPSIDELTKIYNSRYELNRALDTDGDPATTELCNTCNYWSSTEEDSDLTWFISFLTNSKLTTIKNLRCAVRAVRAF